MSILAVRASWGHQIPNIKNRHVNTPTKVVLHGTAIVVLIVEEGWFPSASFQIPSPGCLNGT